MVGLAMMPIIILMIKSIACAPGGSSNSWRGSSQSQEGSSSLLSVRGPLFWLGPICSCEELWFPRVINSCSSTLHLLLSAHHIVSIYNDSRQLEWFSLKPSYLPFLQTRSSALCWWCKAVCSSVSWARTVDKISPLLHIRIRQRVF